MIKSKVRKKFDGTFWLTTRIGKSFRFFSGIFLLDKKKK